MRRIAILTGNHLCHNPRVIKEAAALARAGFEVEVIGAWTDPALKARDQELLASEPYRFSPAVDLAELNAAARIRRLTYSVRAKAGQFAYRFARQPNRWQLGYVIGALARAAQGREADLFIAHSEAALFVAKRLLNSGRRVGVDMEDWFSEDLLPEAREQRPILLLRGLERDLLQGGAYATCPSYAMSRALANAYQCIAPAVIYNTFQWSDRNTIDAAVKDRRDMNVPTIHWLSQTIGPGRGLEDLFAALPLVRHEAEIHLRGNPVKNLDAWLSEQIPSDWRHRIFVHGLVSNVELLSRISEHDIGFAGEMKYCRSRDLTVTNKILHYLLGGLAVVASDTAGQREVAEQDPNAVTLYRSGEPEALASRLNRLLESREELARAKRAALKAADETFCWERQEKALLDVVMRAVRSPRRHMPEA